MYAKLLSKEEQRESDEESEEEDNDPYTPFAATPFGIRGEYRNIHEISAEIKFENKVVGKIKGDLLERPYSQFQDACDCQSGDLQRIGVTFFSDSGKTIVKSVRDAELPESEPWGDMAFLYINGLTIFQKCRKKYESPNDLLLIQYFSPVGGESRSFAAIMKTIMYFIVDDPKTLGRLQQTCKAYCECELETLQRHKKSFFMAHGLKSLLTNTALANNWGLAMYIPECGPDVRAWREANGLTSYKDKLTEKQESAMQLVIKEACKADLCGFLRSGFKQVTDRGIVEDHDCDYVFAVPSFVNNPILSHSDAMSIPFVEPAPRPPPLRGINKELFTHVMEKVFHMPQDQQQQALKDEIKKFVAKGADLSKVPVLHLYVAHGRSEYIPLLLKMGADINLLDESGSTPLHCACQMFGGDGVASMAEDHKKQKARNILVHRFRLRERLGLDNMPESSAEQLIEKVLNEAGADSVIEDLVKENIGQEFRECIQLLVDAGADLTIITPGGLSALGMYWEARKTHLQFGKTMLNKVYRDERQRVTRELADDFTKKILSFPGKVPTKLDETFLNYDPFHVSDDDDY